jgi:predicted aspartyl protease
MARPERARWVEITRWAKTRLSGPPGRRAWALAAVISVIALLTACSGNSGSSAAAAAGSPGRSASASTLAATKTVPMTVVRNGQSTVEIVPVYVDGHGPYRFLLDTGSSVSSVSSRLAKALNLPKTGNHARISGVTSSEKVSIVSIKPWKVGQVTLVPEQVAVVNSSSASGSVMGLLGSDELSRFSAVTENFQHRQLRLTSS